MSLPAHACLNQQRFFMGFLTGTTLSVITGAPGSGKTTVIETLLNKASSSDYIFLDIDWLADSASALAGKSIYTEPSTWQPYGKVWFDVLHALLRNGRQPVFFAPNSPADFDESGLPDWCSGINWLLLDCNDAERTERLKKRHWNQEKIQEALEDAKELRKGISTHIDTRCVSFSDGMTTV